MKNYGGFEHNMQSLRVLDELERRYADFDGLNLMFETREGVLKHCSQHNAQRLGDVAARFLNGGQASLEAQVTNIADEIAYNNHDIDDGVRAGLLTLDQLREVPLFDEYYRQVMARYPELAERRRRYEIVRQMIGRYVSELIEGTRARLAESEPKSISDVRAQSRPLAAYSESFARANVELKQFLMHNLYQHYQVHREMRKAQGVIEQLFELFMTDLRLMPPKYFSQARAAKADGGEAAQARLVADYIAGMTDRYAIDELDRLTNPRR